MTWIKEGRSSGQSVRLEKKAESKKCNAAIHKVRRGITVGTRGVGMACSPAMATSAQYSKNTRSPAMYATTGVPNA